MVIVLRLGHRKIRDQRLTTHVCLVARAFGADGIIIDGEEDRRLIESVQKVVQKWGGVFFARQTPKGAREIEKWKREGGKIAHLTMYGERMRDVAAVVRQEKKLMVVVGAEKVHGEIYRLADYNVAIGNQPHSEAAALAIFLDRYFEGEELEGEFKEARVRIKPNKCGKSVVKCES